MVRVSRFSTPGVKTERTGSIRDRFFFWGGGGPYSSFYSNRFQKYPHSGGGKEWGV